VLSNSHDVSQETRQQLAGEQCGTVGTADPTGLQKTPPPTIDTHRGVGYDHRQKYGIAEVKSRTSEARREYSFAAAVAPSFPGLVPAELGKEQ